MSNKDLIEYVENILKNDKRFYQNRDYEFKNTVKRFYKSKASESTQNNNPTIIMAPSNFNNNISNENLASLKKECDNKEINLKNLRNKVEKLEEKVNSLINP